MQAGGNAIDAAVATGFALAVMHPRRGTSGRRRIYVLLRVADGKLHFLDYRRDGSRSTANADL